MLGRGSLRRWLMLLPPQSLLLVPPWWFFFFLLRKRETAWSGSPTGIAQDFSACVTLTAFA